MSSSPERPSETGPGGCYEVALAGTDLRFVARPGERLLAAARRAGVWLPFECGWGSCGTCKLTLVEGEAELLAPDAPALSPADARRRRILACQSAAASELTLKTHLAAPALRAGPPARRPTRDHVAELTGSEPAGPDIRLFSFALDGVSRYLPGQYAILELGPGLRRCYSMAGLPGAAAVEFIAKRYPGRPGSTALFSLRPGDQVPAELPYGDTWLRPGGRDVVLVAGGTGVSPVLALLRQLASLSYAGRVDVVYGANTPAELVFAGELEALVGRLPAAALHPTVLRPHTAWSGGTGLVTGTLARLLPGSGDADYYVAGPPVMVDSTLAVLREGGVSLDRVHYDRFG